MLQGTLTSGGAVIWVTHGLTVNLSGKGGLPYVGASQLESIAISGAGTISKLKQD